MATTGRHMDRRICRSRLAIEPRGAAVSFGARFFAIVAAHTQGFVNQQDVGRFANPLSDQELDNATGFRRRSYNRIF